jgi:hypothetical protein
MGQSRGCLRSRVDDHGLPAAGGEVTGLRPQLSREMATEAAPKCQLGARRPGGLIQSEA